MHATNMPNSLNFLFLLVVFYIFLCLFFFSFAARKVYRPPSNTFNREHFCVYQKPPCSKYACRVATHIIAGLYPLNFSKFLLKAYNPLKENERRELMTIQKLYLSYLMQKIDDEKADNVDIFQQMDLLWNIDDAEYTLFCDIGSAFAESYLIDMPIPVQDLLDSCFIYEYDKKDIEINMCWLECIYMLRENDQSPVKTIDNDGKLSEFQTRLRMDQYDSLNDVRNFPLSRTHFSSLTAKCNQDLLNDFAIAETMTKGTNKMNPESYERLYMLLNAIKFTNDDKSDDSRVASTLKTICAHNDIAKMKKVMGKTTTTTTTSTTEPPSTPTTEIFKTKNFEVHIDKDGAIEEDVTLSDAVKIAVKKQLNK